MRLHAALFFLVLAATLPAQRSRVLGRVVDRAGKPVAGAKLRLISRVIPPLELGDLDVVEAETSERGTFRASVLDGRIYSGWASWQVDGRTVFTTIHDEIYGGARPRLVEAKKHVEARRVIAKPPEAYASFAPFRYRLRWASKAYFAQELERKGDTLEIPALPYAEKQWPQVEVRSKDGAVLVTWSLGRRAPPGAPKPQTIGFPILVEEQVEVRANGKPLAGARIFAPTPWTRNAWSLAGLTNAEGKAVCRIPRSGGKRTRRHVTMRVVAEGYTAAYASWGWSRGHVNGKKIDAVPERWVFDLSKASPFGGRVLGFDGKPLAGADVILDWSGYYRNSPTSRTGYSTPTLSAKTADDGSFSFDHFESTAKAVNIRVVVPSSAKLPDLGSYPAPPRVLPWHVKRDRKNGEGAGVLDLSKATVAKIDVLRNGEPTRGVFVCSDDDIDLDSWRCRLECSDRRGRASRILLDKNSRLFAFHREHGWYAKGFGEIEGSDVYRVELRPFVSFSGRVTDLQGEPLEGVSFRNSGYMQSGGVEYGDLMSKMNGVLLTGKSDADGKFALSFVGAPNRQTRISVGYRRQNKSVSTRMTVRDTPLVDEKIVLDTGVRQKKAGEKKAAAKSTKAKRDGEQGR